MPQLHLVTGHRCMNRSDAPVLVYCGHDADAANQARDAALKSGAVALADQFSPSSPVTRYADPAAVAKWKPNRVAVAAALDLVAVVLAQRGDDKLTIEVRDTDQAEQVKAFLDGFNGCIAELEKFRQLSCDRAAEVDGLTAKLLGAEKEVEAVRALLAAANAKADQSTSSTTPPLDALPEPPAPNQQLPLPDERAEEVPKPAKGGKAGK